VFIRLDYGGLRGKMWMPNDPLEVEMSLVVVEEVELEEEVEEVEVEVEEEEKEEEIFYSTYLLVCST
jgi:hypothetical protein